MFTEVKTKRKFGILNLLIKTASHCLMFIWICRKIFDVHHTIQSNVTNSNHMIRLFVLFNFLVFFFSLFFSFNIEWSIQWKVVIQLVYRLIYFCHLLSSLMPLAFVFFRTFVCVFIVCLIRMGKLLHNVHIIHKNKRFDWVWS